LEHVAHVDIGDFGDGNFGLLERGFNRDGAEFGRGDCEKGAIELVMLACESHINADWCFKERDLLTFAVGVLEALIIYAS
jgi:hypothetical protein